MKITIKCLIDIFIIFSYSILYRTYFKSINNCLKKIKFMSLPYYYALYRMSYGKCPIDKVSGVQSSAWVRKLLRSTVKVN